MKKNQNINQNPFFTSENCGYDYPSLQYFSSAKGILNFEIFQLTNIYNEKLPIIYANIRV